MGACSLRGDRRIVASLCILRFSAIFGLVHVLVGTMNPSAAAAADPMLHFLAVDSTGKGSEAASHSVPKVIIFFGNSLTAGYGVEPEQAFPALIRRKIAALNWPFKVVNAGLSGETSAGGLRRIDWVLKQKADLLVLELGANDGLRGIPLETTRQNLQAIMDRARSRCPGVEIVVVGMQIPPNLGPEYREQFRSLYPQLAARNRSALVPFLLEGVGGVPELNLPDGIHPNAAGHKIAAANVWKVLKPLLLAELRPLGER